jgi:hypothetical protein
MELLAHVGSLPNVRTLLEIQTAVLKLDSDEKKALSLWLDSQMGPELTRDEERLLLASLDQAIREIDAGKGLSMKDARREVAK